MNINEIKTIYSECDFNVLPCATNTKQTVETWKRWQTEKVDVGTLCRWSRGVFERKDGSTFQLAGLLWAVMTGRRPWTKQPGVVVLDADNVEAIKLVERQCPRTPLTTSTPSGGMHYYYRHPGTERIGQILGMSFGGRSYKLDLKADGGYVMAPGNVVAKGRYCRSTPWTPELFASLPVFKPHWIPQQTKTTPKPVACERLLEITKQNTPRLRKFLASRWIDRQPGAVAGEGADSFCLGLATRLVYGFGCEEEDAIELLYGWGQKEEQKDSKGSHYPWNSSEITHKIRDAMDGKRWNLPGDLFLEELNNYQTERAQNIIGSACGTAD